MIKLPQYVFTKAISKWGRTAQMLKTAEECNELARAILRKLNGYSELDNLVEEIVDVEIMLQQLKFMLTEDEPVFPAMYEQFTREKLLSLRVKLEETGTGHKK